MDKYQTAALLLSVLSVGAMVGGAVSGSADTAQAGGAMMMGGQQILSRSILSYVRQQESAADRAAVEFLNASHQSPAGMLKVFRFFAEPDRRLDPPGPLRPDPSDTPGPHRAAPGDRGEEPLL